MIYIYIAAVIIFIAFVLWYCSCDVFGHTYEQYGGVYYSGRRGMKGKYYPMYRCTKCGKILR